MIIGYMRPFYEDPECECQIKQLTDHACQYIYQEQHAAPKRRTELERMMEQLQPGDTVIVTKLFVWADSTRHLVELLEMLEQKQAVLLSLQEGIETDPALAYPFQTIAKHLVQFQSDAMSENTRQGLLQAKEKGNAPGRPRKPDQNVQRAIEMYQSKTYSLAQIKDETGISKSTLYRYLEQ